MASNYYSTRKGTSLLFSLNFNPLLADVALLHSQIPTNPFSPESLANMGSTQIRNLVFEKHKLGFDELNHALSLFHRMVETRSRLSVIHFNQLLSAVAKMKQYSTVFLNFLPFRAINRDSHLGIEDRHHFDMRVVVLETGGGENGVMLAVARVLRSTSREAKRASGLSQCLSGHSDSLTSTLSLFAVVKRFNEEDSFQP
ncbi:hypothetical protein RHSIM_Rhsim02G0051700 [Rhododendron simsii]|uniref:Pentatricopeptide repeat-containing protein n=1 Tax=Rhododendron simsii TaxID=118357 RepID=A0A834HEI9_RHOSS|nr:hypothetical protein RHSIM_Rhsim02G0051700 [Rhododendron simsii]